MFETNQVKEEALRLVDAMPDDVTWDEFARMVYEPSTIEQIRADVSARRVVSAERLREKFGLER
jgi:hypothetical protein